MFSTLFTCGKASRQYKVQLFQHYSASSSNQLIFVFSSGRLSSPQRSDHIELSNSEGKFHFLQNRPKTETSRVKTGQRSNFHSGEFSTIRKHSTRSHLRKSLRWTHIAYYRVNWHWKYVFEVFMAVVPILFFTLEYDEINSDFYLRGSCPAFLKLDDDSWVWWYLNVHGVRDKELETVAKWSRKICAWKSLF